MILKKKGESGFEEVRSDSVDVLAVRVVERNIGFLLLLVYLDVKDKDRNQKIYEELDRLMGAEQDGGAVLVIGDFNGHVGFLGSQELNFGGRKMLEFVEVEYKHSEHRKEV